MLPTLSPYNQITSASDADPLQIMLPFAEEDLVPQYGSTCKITVLASLDRFFSRTHHFPAIPVYKNSHGFFGKEKSGISLRQLAKQVGSIQGELLDIKQITTLLHDTLGYNGNLLTITTEETFRNTVIEEMKKGQPLVSFFSVNVSEGAQYGMPIVSQNETLEHACLITGYDSINDTLRITHWGKHFITPLSDFYQSNQSLQTARHQESYFSLKDFFQYFFGQQTEFSQQRKYHAGDEESIHSFINLIIANVSVDPNLVLILIDLFSKKVSFIPEEHSGFRGKLICISPLSLGQIDEMNGSEIRLNTLNS